MMTPGTGRTFVSTFLTGSSGARPDAVAHDRYPEPATEHAGDPGLASAWAMIDGKPATSWAALRKNR